MLVSTYLRRYYEQGESSFKNEQRRPAGTNIGCSHVGVCGKRVYRQHVLGNRISCEHFGSDIVQALRLQTGNLSRRDRAHLVQHFGRVDQSVCSFRPTGNAKQHSH